jgi:hypothetical protein
MRTISGRLSEIARRAVIEEAEASPGSKGGSQARPKMTTWEQYRAVGKEPSQSVVDAFPVIAPYLGMGPTFGEYVRWYYDTIKAVNSGKHIVYKRVVDELLRQARERIASMSNEQLKAGSSTLQTSSPEMESRLNNIRALSTASGDVAKVNANVLIGWDTRTGTFPSDDAIDSAKVLARKPEKLAALTQSDDPMYSALSRISASGSGNVEVDDSLAFFALNSANVSFYVNAEPGQFASASQYPYEFFLKKYIAPAKIDDYREKFKEKLDAIRGAGRTTGDVSLPLRVSVSKSDVNPGQDQMLRHSDIKAAGAVGNPLSMDMPGRGKRDLAIGIYEFNQGGVTLVADMSTYDLADVAAVLKPLESKVVIGESTPGGGLMQIFPPAKAKS